MSGFNIPAACRDQLEADPLDSAAELAELERIRTQLAELRAQVAAELETLNAIEERLLLHGHAPR